MARESRFAGNMCSDRQSTMEGYASNNQTTESLMSVVKLFILAVLLVIIASLVSAVVYLVRGREQDHRKMARALTVRIGLSIGLLLFVILAIQLGWLIPHDLLPMAPADNP